MIKNNNSNTRVHTFGIGNGADEYFVKEAAKAGFGKYNFIEDGAYDLNKKVVAALSGATKPSLTHISVDWGDFTEAIKYPTTEIREDRKDPEDKNRYLTQHDDIYEEEVFHLFAILDKHKLSQIISENPYAVATLSCFNTHSKEEEFCEISLSPDFSNLEANDSAFILA